MRGGELVLYNPLGDAAELSAVNPLGKVPALVLAEGRTLFDSRVIADHLDRLAPERQLVPIGGNARDRVLTVQALADGITDAAFATVMENRRLPELRSEYWLERWQNAILRGVQALATTPVGGAPLDLGDIAVAVALDYLLFRLPTLDWQSANPPMAEWLAQAQEWPSLAATAPHQEA
jgi:glutathione S-transferase